MSPAIHRFDVVDSTQHIAKQMARDGCEHGTCVVARQQTAGRGRQQRSWLSMDGALLLSVVLRPQLPMRFATRLPLAVCARLLQAIDAPLLCKWPNDLMIASDAEVPGQGPFRKVGGVLVEAVDSTDVFACAVVGVGLNVRGAVPDAVRATAATLAEAGSQLDAEALLWRVHAALCGVVPLLHDEGFRVVRELLTVRSATLSRRVTVEGVSGIASAIDDDGGLVLLRDNGARVSVRAGDVIG